LIVINVEGPLMTANAESTQHPVMNLLVQRSLYLITTFAAPFVVTSQWLGFGFSTESALPVADVAAKSCTFRA
jgi:hypothetical protein